jgi:hypothetical protein
VVELYDALIEEDEHPSELIDFYKSPRQQRHVGPNISSKPPPLNLADPPTEIDGDRLLLISGLKFEVW